MIGSTDQPLISETIGNFFDQITEKFPDNDALIVPFQSIRWSYKQYQTEINRLAAGLLKIGMKKGDRIGIWSPNCYEWALVQFATAKIGAIMVCLNPAYRLYEVEYALKISGCKAIISAESFKSSEYLMMLNELIPELKTSVIGDLNSVKCPDVQYVIRLGDQETKGMINFNELCEKGTPAEFKKLEELKSSLSPSNPINIQFTSGTTGNPKGATLTHHNILNNGKNVGDAMKLTAEDRVCIPVPLYHCFGMVMGNLACVTHASTALYPAPVFDPLESLKIISSEKCTALYGVPTMFIAELDHPDFSKYDLSSLRTGIIAGAPCPIEIMKRIIKDMHLDEILIAYGQTETSPVNLMTATNDPLIKRVTTVGKAGAHLQIKLIDTTGKIVPKGEKGEICCKGYSIMEGYWNDEVRTKETIDSDGWLHSGDIGIMDAEGYVEITGRIKDMIIRGGENIYPREIEEFLYQHPDIKEIQIFGIPDDKMGEEICAWIQPHIEGRLNEEDIHQFCKGKIAHYKIPHYIHFVKEYPMTATGKMQKFIMQKMMISTLEPTPITK